MSNERFSAFLAQAKRALVAAAREADGLTLSREATIEIGDHITAALCSADAAGTILATQITDQNVDEPEEVEDEERQRVPRFSL